MRSPPTWIAILTVFHASSAFAGDTQTTARETPCIDVQIAGEHSGGLACLNQMLAHQVERAHQLPQLAAPIDAQSSSTAVGTGNVAVAREKMGDQFGKSAIPQRPTQTWVNPLLAPAPH